MGECWNGAACVGLGFAYGLTSHSWAGNFRFLGWAGRGSSSFVDNFIFLGWSRPWKCRTGPNK